MSEKKRVRVYAPQVNTDHFAQYTFQTGGPVDAPGMMQPQDTSNGVVQLLQTYAQVAGLDDQQFQQMYTEIMSMEPDKQAQVISQIQQELNSSMQTNPMMAKSGGYIKSTKKLLSKKIGGVSVNKSKEGVIGIRKGTVENQVGKSFMNSMLDDSIPDYSSAMLPGMDYGGYVTGPMSGMTGYGNVENNPFYTSMQQDEQNMFDAISNASQAVGQLGFRLDEDEPIKVKRTGVARNFGNNPAQVSTDVPTERDGGGMPSYQNAGTTNVAYYPSVNMPYIGQSDAMKVTPEGAFPVYGSNNKPFIVEKSSKSVLGSPYMDEYSRFKTYQANSEGVLESKTDESYPTRNIGGDRVYSYPDRYVKMDTLGYSQGRQEFPVVVTEKNIADGFGGSYDVNRFNATREQVPALIRSMKNQTSQTNAEKVKANADAVHKNALKVEKNRRKVLKLSPLTQYEEEQILKGNYENGGEIESYQTAGSVYVNESYAPAFEDLNIRDEDYIDAKKAYESGSFTPDQLDMINRVESYVNNLKSNPAYSQYSSTNQTQNNNASTNTGSATGINGWHGGFFWKDGQAVTSAADIMRGMQQGAGENTDFSQIFQSGDRRSRIEGNLMDLVRNPYAMKQFGKALNQFGYPVSKVKAKVNPFGAKVKIIFDDKGNPVGQQAAGEDDGSLAGTPVQSNMVNRIRSGFQSNVDEGESSGFMNKFNSAFEGMKTRRYARKYGEPDMSTMGQPAPATTTGSTSAPIPMGRTSGSGMGSIYEPDITTPNPVYAPVQVQPRQTMEDLGEFAIGGNAGKLVLKQGMDYDIGSIGRMISPLMDAGAAFLKYGNQQKRENQIYNTGRYVPSIPAGMQGSKGTDGTASLTGKQIPNLKTLFAGKATYQGIPMSPLATGFEYGGTYDLGGEYQEGDIYEDLSDEQLDDIFKRGGQVQYI